MHVPPQDYIFIADEAGISNDRFTIVGGICLHRETLRRAYETMAAYRKKYGMHAELKWDKISPGKIEEYTALVAYFFAMNSTNHMHFHSICFDSHSWMHKKFNGGDADVGLSKLYYQLMVHKFVKIYGNSGSLYVRMDHRNSSTPLEDIRRMLNATAARDHGITNNPVKQLVSEDSKKCDLLQINDVILGAVCAARNGRHLIEGGNTAKKAIANLVLEKSGLATFEKNSAPSINRFTIWNMQPKK
jgi:hypothetical protein